MLYTIVQCYSWLKKCLPDFRELCAWMVHLQASIFGKGVAVGQKVGLCTLKEEGGVQTKQTAMVAVWLRLALPNPGLPPLLLEGSFPMTPRSIQTFTTGTLSMWSTVMELLLLGMCECRIQSTIPYMEIPIVSLLYIGSSLRKLLPTISL